MKISPFIRSAGSSALIAGLTVLAATLVPTATAATAQGQQTYTCAITVDENPTEPSYMDLTANVSLNMPDHVKPGSEFTVDGTFSVQLPGELASLFDAYFPSARVTSDSVTLPMNIGGQQQIVRTSYIDSGKLDTRKPPIVFGGSFTTDPVTVPQDAQGEVSITLPQNGTVPAISRDGMAAFTAVMAAQGGIVPGYEKGTDRISCDVAGDQPAQIGTIPISAPAGGGAAASPGNNGAGGASAAGGAAAGGGAGAAMNSGGAAAAAPNTAGNRVQDAQAVGSTPNAGAPAPQSGEATLADGSSSQATQELADQLRLQSLNQAASHNDGINVPLSLVGWGTLGIVLASFLFTVATNARTRRLIDAADFN